MKTNFEKMGKGKKKREKKKGKKEKWEKNEFTFYAFPSIENRRTKS